MALGGHLRAKKYQVTLLRRLYLLSEQIDPKSLGAREGAAICDTELGHFSEAAARWSRSIEEAEQGEIPTLDMNFAEWYLQRAINAVVCARETILHARDLVPTMPWKTSFPGGSKTARRAASTSPKRIKNTAIDYDLTEAEALIEVGNLETRQRRRDEATEAFEGARGILKEMVVPTDKSMQERYDDARNRVEEGLRKLSCPAQPSGPAATGNATLSS